jgi:acyl-[acyl carrier protein]--UDP-N-acetylglucosamine O-acyltransferase
MIHIRRNITMIFRRHKNKYVYESDTYGEWCKLYLGKNSEIEYLTTNEYKRNALYIIKVGDNTTIHALKINGDCKIGSNCIIRGLNAGQGVHIHNNVKIESWVRLSAGVKILNNCMLGDNVKIKGKYSVIGPRVIIPEGIKIYPTVEIRKSIEDDSFFNYYSNNWIHLK